LLSTPLTVCLGVLGRHVTWLRFLDVMIGDEPSLSPAQSFYQRALAGDIDEAVDQVVEILPRRSLSYVYDRVVLEALNLAQIDFRRGLLDPKHVEQINEAVHELMADTIDSEDVTPAAVARKKTTIHLWKRATSPHRCRIFLYCGICRPSGAQSPFSVSAEGDPSMMPWRGC
jgi:hypothetical protein